MKAIPVWIFESGSVREDGSGCEPNGVALTTADLKALCEKVAREAFDAATEIEKMRHRHRSGSYYTDVRKFPSAEHFLASPEFKKLISLEGL